METLTLTKILAEKVETIASKMHVSSNQLVTIALEDFFTRQQNKQLFEALNEAYSNSPNDLETKELKAIKTKTSKVLDEWK
jgi:predicted transcriptional regulator